MRIIKNIGMIFVFFGLILSYYLFYIEYGVFLTTVSDIVGVSDKYDSLKLVLTQEVFSSIRIFSLLPLIVGILLFIYSIKIQLYIDRVRSLLRGIVDEVKLIDKKYFLMIFFIIFTSSIYKLFYAISLPISYDEAWTYINFTDKGLLSSISYYPAPNNHVLYSVLTNLTNYLPFNQTINIRLPSIFISAFSTFIFYLVFRKMFNNRIAIYITAIFSFLYAIVYYGYLARGYSLVVLAFIICFYGSSRLLDLTLDKNIQWKYYFYLSFGAVLGLYSIPSFLYPYFALTTFLAFNFVYHNDKKGLVNLLISILATTIVTIIIYSPILIVSGLESMSNNGGVQIISRFDVASRLYQHFKETLQFLFYYEWILLLIIFLSVFSLIKVKNNPKIKLAIYIILISPLILLIHSTIPFERTWIYLIVPILFLLGVFVHYFFTERNSIYFDISFLFMTIALGISYNTYIKDYSATEAGNMTKFSLEADKLSKFLISKKANKIYANHPTLEAHITYSYDEQHIPLDLVYSSEDLPHDEILKNNNFDYLITEQKINLIPGYRFLRKMCVSCSGHGEHAYVYIKI